MLYQTTGMGESTHPHAPASATLPITLEGVVRKPTTGVQSASRHHEVPKRAACKTCEGKGCIGRCRF